MEKEKILDLEGITLEELLKKAVETKTEIHVTVEPDRQEVTIQPWKPFEYKCPAAPAHEAEMLSMPEPGMEPVREALGTNLWEAVFMRAMLKRISFSDMLREIVESAFVAKVGQING